MVLPSLPLAELGPKALPLDEAESFFEPPPLPTLPFPALSLPAELWESLSGFRRPGVVWTQASVLPLETLQLVFLFPESQLTTPFPPEAVPPAFWHDEMKPLTVVLISTSACLALAWDAADITISTARIAGLNFVIKIGLLWLMG
jgi:hypothetical protein